jgi:hypothetical protein
MPWENGFQRLAHSEPSIRIGTLYMSAWRKKSRSGWWYFWPSGIFSIIDSLVRQPVCWCGRRADAVLRPLRITSLVCVGLGVVLLGCQTAGPHLHSQADRAAYAQLSSEDRLLVDNGRLKAGMTPETVKLTWGKPNVTRAVVADGKERIVWLYYGTRWVDQPTWESVYTGRYGQPCLEYRVYRVGIPFVRARAVFEGDRLIDWQRS